LLKNSTKNENPEMKNLLMFVESEIPKIHAHCKAKHTVVVLKLVSRQWIVHYVPKLLTTKYTI